MAYLAGINFEPNIQYDAPDDGLPTTYGVEVFASGLRNPFGICLHSNGYLYGTDNGPNLGYGDMMMVSKQKQIHSYLLKNFYQQLYCELTHYHSLLINDRAVMKEILFQMSKQRIEVSSFMMFVF